MRQRFHSVPRRGLLAVQKYESMDILLLLLGCRRVEELGNGGLAGLGQSM
jgi:hypothetical protein